MSWLSGAVIKAALEWVYGKVVDLFSFISNQIKFWLEANKISKENERLADAVQTTADEIRKLIEAGQPVPDALREKLREESRNLIHGRTNTPRS